MKKLSNFSRVDETQFALTTRNVNMLYYDLPQHFQGEYRSYEEPRLCTILRGTKEVHINQSEQFTYQKEQCVLLPPHSTVYMSMSEYTQALVYEFSDEMVESVSAKVCDQLEFDTAADINQNYFKLEQLQSRVHALHTRVQDILNSDDKNVDFLLDLTCQELVYELLKRQGCNEILSYHSNHPINKAIRLMKSRQSHGVSISDLADEANMTLPNFSQKFKLVTNQTPKEYLTKLRLNRSKILLNKLSVTDTAMEVGYENISHFIRLFKKEFGLTPKQFKLAQSPLHH